MLLNLLVNLLHHLCVVHEHVILIAYSVWFEWYVALQHSDCLMNVFVSIEWC